MHPGDVFMLNAPYNGGTHLPDITVVTPVFDADGKTILFYTASRGHHADVGGMAPGSMTPLATTSTRKAC
jgi:5-oxoprolinase (ATP-hydrolysing)